MLGGARHTRLWSLLPWPGTTQRLVRGGNGIALHIVSRAPTANDASPATGEPAREEPTREGDNDGAGHVLARPRAAGGAVGPEASRPPCGKASHGGGAAGNGPPG